MCRKRSEVPLGPMRLRQQETIQGSLPTKDTFKIEISPLNLTNVRRGTRAAENMVVGGRRAGFTTGLDLGARKGISAA